MYEPTRIIDAVIKEVRAGRRVALCAIVATRGSTPQPVGTMICVDEAAAITGTLGGGCVEADVRRQAHQLLSARVASPLVGGAGKTDSSRSSSTRDDATGPHGGLITFALNSDFGYDDGMICGGRIDVAVGVLSASSPMEPYTEAVEQLRAGLAAVLPVRIDTADGLVEYRVHLEAEPKLIIVGGGHISRVLARMLLPLGFSVHVIDDRADYANAERFPQPIRTTAGDIATLLEAWSIDGNTYIVIVTRGHRHDEIALQAVVDSPAKYIGMIGSRRKIKVIFDDLRRAGATDASLSEVHAPIGLDISAVTTDEIAVSIAAELVSVRRAKHRGVVQGPISVSLDE